ncbi:hypothetical protein HPB47_023653 [Ixodes persulcatus]|uniref:Uncharacterized protein n=1 Tax=Ixodes persulcatus TaxID=34615 RepID=A0AC60Q6E1_IXOPE|nr:hypothetical protein HPB47_023653 [Ixodes persulcatus]
MHCFSVDSSVLVAITAGAVCRSRVLAFSIRHRILPLDVLVLFGGCQPSTGHAMRICKILRTECQWQIRLYRECLHLRLRGGGDRSSCGGSRWRELSRTIDRTADFFWQQTLPLLRASIPGRHPAATGNKVHKLGDVRLPKQVEQELSHAPKFAVEPRRSPPKLLSLVRQVSGRAAESEADRCIADGVDVLLQCRPSGSRVPVRFTVAYLKDNALSLLPADKEGGFVVLPKGMFNSKASDAIEATFQVGAMASHMAKRLPNPFDSDSCHNSQPVLSLPPAAMFEAMVAPTYDCDEIPDDPASPLPGTSNSPGPSGASPARTTTPPLLPRVRSPSVTQPRSATNRIAALERALAPEKEARVAALQAEEKRKRAQHAIQMRLFRGQLAAQEATQRHQQEMSRLELELFRQRSQLELELLQLNKKLKEKQLAAFTSLPHG